MVSNKCESVHKIVEDALAAYESWSEVKGLSAYPTKLARFPIKCESGPASSSCEIKGKIDALDITGMQYQTLTSAQDEATHMWDIEFLQNVYGVSESDFQGVIDWCRERPGKKADLCMTDMPTAIAIGLLYGRYPENKEDWRLSVRLGLSAMKFPNQYLMKKVFRVLDLDVNAIEIMMISTY